MYKHIGMTGTRDGMSQEQKNAYEKYIQALDEKLILHHGDCIGADADAHDIAVRHNIKTHIHPPIKDVHRAFKEGDYSEEEKSYFARNRDIVDSAALVLGFPKLMKETKGGTWYTINYTKNKGTPLVIIWPNGELEYHNAG